MATSNIAFTPLVETSSVIVPPPKGFNVAMGWLMAQCCALTYSQYDLGPGKLPDFTTLTLGSGYKITATNAVPFVTSEPAGPGSIPGDVGDYYPAAAGFGVALSIASLSGPSTTIIVIALRGTRTWTEWVDDAEAVPLGFDGTFDNAFTYGAVHAGILGYYTLGINGATYGSNGWMAKPSYRPPGSLAAQIYAYMLRIPSKYSVYVTGHSLGGALASICAYDLALNFQCPNSPNPNFCVSPSSLFMYNLASPRVVMGGDVDQSSFFQVNVSIFLKKYQPLVPNSFRIVHACDIIPILAESSLSLGPINLTSAHVTDAYQGSNGLSGNVVNFCAQTGDISMNHACVLTYLPYMQWLAANSKSEILE
jgi:lipase (class 3)